MEAIAHLRQGLALLATLPESRERIQREVDMHIALGASLIATKSAAAPEVQQTYTRARQLCQHRDDPQRLFPVLRGLWIHYTARTELRTAHELGEQLLDLAQKTQEPVMLTAAHRALAGTLFYLGEITSALTHATQGITLYDPQQHGAFAFLYGDDAGVVCRSQAAWTLWCLGYPDQGLTRSQEAVTLAQQIAHPFSLAYALSYAAIFHQFRREVRAAQEHAEAAIRLSMEQGFPLWRTRAAVVRGWILAHQGQTQEGIQQITQSLMTYRATGAEVLRPYWLALLVEVHGTLGEPEEGLTALTEALALVDTTGERWYEPELYRFKGELLLQQASNNQAEVENCFHHALDITRHQQLGFYHLSRFRGSDLGCWVYYENTLPRPPRSEYRSSVPCGGSRA